MISHYKGKALLHPSQSNHNPPCCKKNQDIISVVVLSNAPYYPFADKCKKLGASAYFTQPETFLDDEQFAHKTYGAVKACIHN